MYYITDDGCILRSRTPARIVRELNALSFSPEHTDKEWMIAAASRIWMMTGRSVRCVTAKAFVEDLLKLGLLRKDYEQ